MELLLDTCTLLWALFDDKNLPQETKDIINNPDNDIFVSSVSLWEIAIKNNYHPELMPITVEELFNVLIEQTDFSVLDIHYNCFFYLKEFIDQNIHRDHFDQLLLSIAKVEDFTLVTCDKNLVKYEGAKIINY